jgi:hypothetical protein
VPRHTGYAPEEPLIYAGLTARELVELAARLHGMGAHTARFAPAGRRRPILRPGAFAVPIGLRRCRQRSRALLTRVERALHLIHAGSFCKNRRYV